MLKRILRSLYYRFFREDPVQVHIRNGLVVGRNFSMLSEVILDPSHVWHIRIGDDVTLAPRVHILAHDASTKIPLGYTRIGRVVIGNRVFVGAGSTILPGVTIGDDVIIGAGSVVSRDIPSGSVAAGSPAKVITTLEAYLDRKRQELETHPVFGAEFTVEGGITDEKKQEMHTRLQNGIGYVI